MYLPFVSCQTDTGERSFCVYGWYWEAFCLCVLDGWFVCVTVWNWGIYWHMGGVLFSCFCFSFRFPSMLYAGFMLHAGFSGFEDHEHVGHTKSDIKMEG